MAILESRRRAILRFQSLLKHSKGLTAGQEFKLEDWQEKFVTELLCTVKEDGSRQYRTAFLAVSRKNGKSTLCSSIAIFLLFNSEQAKPEIICAAASREQARLIFTCCCELIESSPLLSANCQILRNEIRTKDGGILKTIAAEARTAHGMNPTAILIDEFHAQSSREFYDVLASSVGARIDPLLIMITTAGVEQTSICREMWTYAEQVRDGVIEDDSFYPLIFAADPSDDPFDEAVWY